MGWLFNMGRLGKKKPKTSMSVTDGIITRDIDELKEKLSAYESKQRSIVNALDKCKVEIHEIEGRIRKKCDEYEHSNANAQRIVRGEIENLETYLNDQEGEYNGLLEKQRQYNVMIVQCKRSIQNLHGSTIEEDAGFLTTCMLEGNEQNEANKMSIEVLAHSGSDSKQEQEEFDIVAKKKKLLANMEIPKQETEKVGYKGVVSSIAKAPRVSYYETL